MDDPEVRRPAWNDGTCIPWIRVLNRYEEKQGLPGSGLMIRGFFILRVCKFFKGE
jgi:hypothetical protein